MENQTQYNEIMKIVQRKWKETSDLLNEYKKQKNNKTPNLLGLHLHNYFQGLIDTAEILKNKNLSQDLTILNKFILTRFQY